jgi:hypothetical protein
MRGNFGYSDAASARLGGPRFRHVMGVVNVHKSVLDAIREGDWFFEPAEVKPEQYSATKAIPGTREKLAVLAARAQAGLPLWHKADRSDYEDADSG